jgi:hypothetical protein
LVLTDSEGNLTTEPHDLSKYGAKISANDPFITLHDGQVAWTWLEQDQSLQIAILPTNF